MNAHPSHLLQKQCNERQYQPITNFPSTLTQLTEQCAGERPPAFLGGHVSSSGRVPGHVPARRQLVGQFAGQTATAGAQTGGHHPAVGWRRDAKPV